MRIVEPDYDRVRHVAVNMRQSDIDEFMAVSPAETPEMLKFLLVERYFNHQSGLVAMLGETPVAVGAMLEATPKVVTLMFFATERFAEIATPLTRFIRQRLFKQYREAGVHRIQCVSVEGYAQSHRWIKALGLKQEAILRGLGKNGETFIQFSWVSDDVGKAGAGE